MNEIEVCVPLLVENGDQSSMSPHSMLVISRTGVWPLSMAILHKTPENMYGLLTKWEVKMAGYWPSSFFACLWTETKSRSINSQKKNEANIQLS